jgi:prepilin-type N-terminal cleavage/methylation domain-containing protein
MVERTHGTGTERPMKTKTQKRWITDGESRSVFHQPAARPFSIPNPKFKIQNLPAFTLIELLVVISIMAVLAALTIPVIHSVKRQQYIRNVQAEMQQVETALENYKAKYGFYPPSNQNGTNSYLPLDRSQFSQLYYELSGTTLVTNGGTIYFSTLDGSSQIKVTDVNTAYGVSGFINCSKGSGEDAVAAKNFLSGFTPSCSTMMSFTRWSIGLSAIICPVSMPLNDRIVKFQFQNFSRANKIYITIPPSTVKTCPVI